MLNEEDERTTPLGLFNTAESYWKAAVALQKAKVRSTHPDAPISFLYYHAIELYLKSYLRMHGHSVKELAGRKFGHNVSSIRTRTAELGLHFDGEDIEVLNLMENGDAVIRSRYIQTGAFRWSTPEALDRTCKSLRQSVGEVLKGSGIRVRF